MQPSKPSSPSDWKNYGNKQFVLRRYAEALKAYNAALSLSKNVDVDVDLLANRAAAWLNLEFYDKALDDTNLALQKVPSHAKAIYRKGRALLGMSKADEAVAFLKTVKVRTKETQELLERAEVMAEQAKTLDYDVTEHFYHYFTKIENWVEYYGSAEVRSIPGKGRGLVATANIGEGQLIFCARAFAVEFHDKEAKASNSNNNTGEEEEEDEDCILHLPEVSSLHDRGGSLLVQQIYNKIKLVPEVGRKLYQLYAGPELGSLDYSSDPSLPNPPTPDLARISGIVRYNCFANSEDNSDVEKASALFLVPSFFNHRCIGVNCTWKIYGNFIMIRAYKFIKKGEELLISYASPTWSFKVRHSLFHDRLGFSCSCDLCILDKTLSPEVITVREKLQKLALKQQVEFVGLNPESDPAEIYKKFEESSSLLVEIVRRLEDLHPKHGPLNVLVLDPLQQLGMKYFGVGDYKNAADTMERAHGVMRTAALPHGAVECMLWVVGSYLHLGDTKKAKKYIEVLKKDALLAHGTIRTLRMMGEWVINAMAEYNVSL